MKDGQESGGSCPVPAEPARVQLAHGGGGRMMRDLIERYFLRRFERGGRSNRHDAAVMPSGGEGWAFTTDTYVVSPLFFPGGDIGRLAVLGTANDLAMAGARPQYLSAAFVLEEGLHLDVLERVAESMQAAAEEAGVAIVTGDTKVVDRGKGDGIYVNTSGLGVVAAGRRVEPGRVAVGDAIIVSGDVGRHGLAVLSVRSGLELETPIESDLAALSPLVEALFSSQVDVHCLRDLTRGGLAAALNEIALDASRQIEIDETCVPVSEGVRGAAELLGLDPLYVACEGRFVAFVPMAHGPRVLDALAGVPGCEGAAVIGEVVGEGRGFVHVRTALGVTRTLDLLSGQLLPRIC